MKYTLSDDQNTLIDENNEKYHALPLIHGMTDCQGCVFEIIGCPTISGIFGSVCYDRFRTDNKSIIWIKQRNVS